MANFKEIKKDIEELPASKKEMAKALLNKAEFMEDELAKLQKVLKEKGWTESYQNGANQYGVKKSSEADAYNTLIKNYSTIIRQIDDLLPKGSQNADEFLEFIK